MIYYDSTHFFLFGLSTALYAIKSISVYSAAYIYMYIWLCAKRISHAKKRTKENITASVTANRKKLRRTLLTIRFRY